MQPVLAYVEINLPDDNPGNNGPIQPIGGDPGHLPRKHAVGVLGKASINSRVPFRTLADLRLRVPPDAKPEGARICIYKGRGQNSHPVGQDYMTLQVENGRVRYFKINPSTAPSIVPHLQANNTLGIEISAPFSSVPLVVLSRTRIAKIKARSKTRAKKSKKATARSAR